MSLTLTIENVEQLDNAESTQLRLDRHGAAIGRSPHSDWSLPDAKNYISSTHCEVEFRDGVYVITDRSTNGTFLNDAPQRMSGSHTLADGDLLVIGQYRVRVRTGGGASGAAAAAPPPAAKASSGGWDAWSGGASNSQAAASPGWDSAPAGSPATAANTAASGWATDAAPAPDAGPGSWDARAAPASGPGWGAASPAAPASSGWEAADTSPSAQPGWWDASAPSGGGGAAPSQQPAAAGSAWGAGGAGPAQPQASGWDAIGPARDAAGPHVSAAESAASPISGRGALSQSWAAPRAETPAAPPPPAPEVGDVWGKMAQSNDVDWNRSGFGTGADWGKPVAVPAAAAATAPSGSAGAAWDAFLQAAGVAPDTLKAEPVQVASTAGALLKHLVAGLVVMLEARARAKAQLGAQSTTLELKGNNPIKFARSPERVVAQLLNPPERGFMGSEDAAQDSFRDLQAHQMATLAAMQGALRSTLERFSPDAIRQRAEMRGVLAKILPSARDASLWQAYEREFEGVAKGSDEAFMDVFAKAFKAAYEQAAIQMKSQNR